MDELEIGPDLRRAREARGLSIEAAAEATKIRARYIEALEQEDFAALPAPVFATGLLRSYSAYLGLDPNVMVARLGVQPAMRPRAAIESESGIVRPTASIAPRLLAIGAVVLVALALAYVLYTQYTAFVAGERDAHPASSPPATATRSAGTTPTVAIAIVPPTAPTPIPPTAAPPKPTQPAATVQPTRAPVATWTPTASPTPSDIVIIQAKFLDRVWVQVEVDDKVAASKTWNAGDQGEWRGKKIFLWTGNAYSVEVTYNGKPLGRLGARGELVKVTWTAQRP